MLVSHPGIDFADKLGVQTQPCAERAAAGPGEPLARPRRDTQSQVRGKAIKSSPRNSLLYRKPAGIVKVLTAALFKGMSRNKPVFECRSGKMNVCACSTCSFIIGYWLFNLALNARYKGKSYRATVEVVRTADRVADFCRKTCIKLECCPNLFGPRMVLDRCSENCSVLTKTKYSKWVADDFLSHLLAFN